MIIALELTIVAQQDDLPGPLVVIGDHHTAVAEGAEIFAGIKTEAAIGAEGARLAALILRAVGLAGILNHRQVVAPGDGHHLVHAAAVAVEMDRDDRPRARADLFLDEIGIDAEGEGIDVDQHRRGPGEGDRREGRNGGVGDGDHFIARLHSAGDQGEVEGFGARAHTDGMAHPEMSGKGLLEGAQLPAQNEPAAGQDPADSSVDLLFHPQIVSGQIAKWYLHPDFHLICSR
ncbi:MAG: hypothetical protein BWY77_02004 [bacterium ADurb.Bin431]|nr:MAG: hypothetical protein BWY77_02004 [bacterium ADurb.Bin431]